MASTTAMFTGLSGLNVNSRNIDMIGNNIANVNTFGYKSGRMLFSSMFSRTLSAGGPPGDVSGGTNPMQIGLGVQIAGTQRNFSTGSFTTTGDARDMAIEGNGFFVVRRGEQDYYTRMGAFRPNADNDLVSITGDRLMGWGVDEDYNVVRGSLSPINVPVGSLTIAEPTRTVRFAGNLDAAGPLPTVGSRISLLGAPGAGLRTISTAAPAPTPPNLIEATTRLVDIEDPAAPGSDTPQFVAGQTIRISGISKGGTTLPDAELTIAAGTTVQDLMDFLRDAMGLLTTPLNPDGSTPGLAVDGPNGAIVITGNPGTANDLTIDNADIRIFDSAGQPVKQAFHADKTVSADGESVRTGFIAYDSLGTPINLTLTLVKDSVSNAGTTWRYFVESGDDAGLAINVGSGTISFDTQGRLLGNNTISVTVDRSGSGADTPLGFQLTFAYEQDTVTSLDGTRSQLAATRWDGARLGTLEGFGIGNDGVITGSFSNGLTRVLGQVPLATFSSPEGLLDVGGNVYTVSGNSGSAVVTSPLELSAGKVVSGALELSNVDLGQEFIGLILAQTGYSAASRVVSTTNDLFQQLLALGR